MKSKLLVSLMLLSLLTSALALTAHTQLANASNDNVQLYINPPEIDKAPGAVNSFFDVYLNITGVTDLFGFDIKVTWADNTLITIDASTSNTTTGTILDGVWGPGNWMMVISDASGGGGGGGYFRIVALSTHLGFTGDHDLMNLHLKIMRNSNFLLQTSIHIDTHKLSDSNYTPITATLHDGLFTIGATKPDLEFEFYDPNSTKPIEYCKIFQVRVYVTDVCANLEDYNLVIAYDNSLLKLVSVDWTGGVLGGSSDGASYTESPPGTINVVDTGGTTWSGAKGLLFTLTFHVEFNDDPAHIWREDNLGPLTAFVKFTDGTLSFVEGTITMSGITMPSDQHISVNLIRGDVDCNGIVDVFDLRAVAAKYDQSYAKYDLTADGTIDIFDLVAVATHIGYGS